MKFGEKYTKKCVTCGNEFEGFTSSKYCSDGCKPQNRKHRKKEEVKEDDTSNTSIIKLGSDGTINNSRESDNRSSGKDVSTDNNISTDQSDIIQEPSLNSIQIIDSNTGKKEKGIIDQIFEKAFSEEFAPITTSLLGALVARLQKPNNATEDGMLTAEDGSKHAMI